MQAPVSVGAPGYKGAITVGLKFERIDDAVGKLLVDVKEAKDLAAADPNQLSNPFVKRYSNISKLWEQSFLPLGTRTENNFTQLG